MMITGNAPFSGKNVTQIRESIEDANADYSRPVWTEVSKDVQDLLKKMLEPNPTKRLSADQVLKHPWFASLKNKKLSSTPLNSEVMRNLNKFHAENKLEKSILTFISTQVVEDNSNRELAEMFTAIDRNNDGRLSQEEIINGYIQLGFPAAEAEKIIKEVDVDKSGMIEYSEFITASQDWKKLYEKDVIEKAFKTYDIGGDGCLSLAELKQQIPGIEETEWSQFIQDADKNGDGVISLTEFKDYLVGKVA